MCCLQTGECTLQSQFRCIAHEFMQIGDIVFMVYPLENIKKVIPHEVCVREVCDRVVVHRFISLNYVTTLMQRG